MVQIKTTFVNGNKQITTSGVALWAKYGATGDAGKGISAILNYYATTKTTDAPQDSDWQLNKPKNDLSPEYKYLWNYEEIQYTKGDPTVTDPAIIGAYGDSGTGSVDFQIYSTDGFEFSEDVSSIELKTVAFYGGQKITSGVTYQWKWWNTESTADDKYENIENAYSSTLTVQSTDAHAYSSLKCVMSYNGIDYEDYVTLTKKTTVYTSVVKFFGGTNVFSSTDKYLVAYVELYKNGVAEESILTNQQHYSSYNSIQDDGTINTNLSGDFSDGELVYFIYANGSDYNVVLGEYNSGSWRRFNQEELKYDYKNTFKTDITSNVFTIPRNLVSRSDEINVDVCIKGTDTKVSVTSAIVIDTNDPIISDEPPEDVKDGQLWLDTSSEPYTLYVYTLNKKDPYTLGDAERIDIYSSSDSSTEQTVSYGDRIQINDNGTVEILNKQEVSFSYQSYTNANVLPGNFYTAHGTKSIYYALPTATVSTWITTWNGNLYYYVRVSEAQEVVVDLDNVGAGKWVYFNQQNGGIVYTSKPVNGYKAGDLWIVSEEDDECDDYTPGTMLKATVTSNKFDLSHWTDSMSYVASTIKNIKETFEWDDTGLKIRKQIALDDGTIKNPFYVQITSEKMGFHSVSEDGRDSEVVHIGNNSAVIQNATFEGENGTTFNTHVVCNNNVRANGQLSMSRINSTSGFVFQMEENGSLSLAIMKQ